MQTVGYCRECGRYVAVTETGCEWGHSRVAVGDVRNIPDEDPMPGSTLAARGESGDGADRPGSDANEIAMEVAAKGIIIVPAALVLGIIIWASVEGEMAMGFGLWPAVLATVAGLALSFGFFYVRRLGRRR